MANKSGKSNNSMGKQTNAIGRQQVIRLFIWICIYRLANAWMIRTQFDPDEYWQTLEPAYCLVFGSADDSIMGINSTNNDRVGVEHQRIHGCALTWEWTRRWTPPSDSTTIQPASASVQKKIIQAARTMTEQALNGPVRSYISIIPTYCYYLACRSLFHWADTGIDQDNKGNLNYNVSEENFLVTYCTRVSSYLKQFIRRHATYLISKGPVFLHAILVAAPTDLSVWLVASRMNNLVHPQHNERQNNELSNYWQSWPFWALACSITSWFNGYALVRTYANSFETVCLIVGIALLGPELFGQTDSELNSGNNPQHRHRLQAKLAFVLGGLSACVRFTALAAWIPVGLIITLRSGRRNNMLQTLIGLCGAFGLTGVILGCCIDCWFYGFWAMPVLGNIHFNVLLDHGSLYGTHPFLWYAYAGIPAICGILLPFFLFEFATLSEVASCQLWTTFCGFWGALTNSTPPKQDKKKEIECNNTINNPQLTLLGIIAPYILLHSFSGHKEFRFLLPILPIICIMAGHAINRLVHGTQDATNGGDFGSRALKKIMGKRTFAALPKLLFVALILLNYPHLLYLGIIHQRGPIAVNQYLADEIDKDARLVARNNKGGNSQHYTIHYLMGCHSAPLYSHLHISNSMVDAWHLDCSPDCRANPEAICESDAFSNDPLGFVTSVYGISGDSSCMEVDVVRELPYFLVVMQDDAMDMGNALSKKMKMAYVGSLRHTIKSLSWHRQPHLHGSNNNQFLSHDVATLFSLIDVHFDHMEVFRRS